MTRRMQIVLPVGLFVLNVLVGLSGWFLYQKQKKEDENEENECMICKEKIRWHNAVLRTCEGTQTMHRDCVARWYKKHPRCPHCRRVDEETPEIDEVNLSNMFKAEASWQRIF